eukprot:c32495_g1_i1.p1 GENE.c32495_g1_i1~~c32495_g1_i1.p1  ORF type:complete len:431 (+),score=48.64 c32495_g1_i1:39-1331(+)
MHRVWGVVVLCCLLEARPLAGDEVFGHSVSELLKRREPKSDEWDRGGLEDPPPVPERTTPKTSKVVPKTPKVTEYGRQQQRIKELDDSQTVPWIAGMQSSRICSPTLFEVKHDETSASQQFRWQSLTASDVLHHLLSTLRLTQFAKVPETPFSNIDGRINHPVLGTMGGDAGEFILALNAYEQVMQRELSEFQVATLLSDFLTSVNKGRFYLQTDQMALLNLCRTIKFCLPSNRLDNPPLDMIPTLRKELLKPENLGCSHIRHLLQMPEEFSTRPELTQGFIKAFFNLLWGVPINSLPPDTLAFIQSRLKLQILSGPHTEGAVLRVLSDACSNDFIPMIVPEFGKVSVAVYHVGAATQLRASVGKFLQEQAAKMHFVWNKPDGSQASATEFATKMNDIAEAQFRVAVGLDEGKTPVFSINYPGSCCMGSG